MDYIYDELHRLTKEVVMGDPESEDVTIEYAYDKVGNRTSQKVTNSSGTVETTYTYDHNDRLTHEHIDGTLSRTYTYDDNGNLDTVDIEEQPGAVDIDYTWDAENRLTAVAIHDGQGGTQNIAYEYDAQGVRVSKTVDGVETKYLIDPMRPYAQVLEEYTGEGGTRDVQTSYTYGNDLIGQDQDGTDFFYLEDLHSGVRQMTNSSGVVTDTYEYDAYGNLLAETGSTVNNYLYRGEQVDPDVDLQYLRARYYDPATGRFLSTDPFEGYLEQPVSRHRYLYAHDNPIMYSDPSGLTPLVQQFLNINVLGILASMVTSAGAAAPSGVVLAAKAASITAGITTAAALTANLIKSKPSGWVGVMLTSSIAGPPGWWKNALLSPVTSIEQPSKFGIAPLNWLLNLAVPGLGLKVGGGIFSQLSTPVSVAAKSVYGVPSKVDLGGPYFGPTAIVKFPNPEDIATLLADIAYPNSIFLMGFGLGKATGPSTPVIGIPLGFSVGLDIGISVPL